MGHYASEMEGELAFDKRLAEEAERQKRQVDRFYAALDQVIRVKDSAFYEDRKKAMQEFLLVVRHMKE